MNLTRKYQHDSEGRRHGVWEGYYRNGTLSWRRHYHQGREHGVWEEYYPNGTLGWRGNYHHGKQKGLAMWRDPQGRCTQKAYHLVIR